MNLSKKKRMAASALKASPKRVIFNPERLEDISKAITKADVRSLKNEGAIAVLPKRGNSNVRSKKRKEQKRKGRRRGQGSRKGKKTARLPRKQSWMASIRSQRAYLQDFREKGYLENKVYRALYRKCCGGFFRSKRHIRIYMDEHNLLKGVSK